jgi:Uma2 family endonuclease
VREVTFESIETLSQAEFAEWLAKRAPREDPRRYELLNGRIVMNPPAGWPHGESEVEFAVILLNHARERRLGRVFGASQGFELPTGDTLGPDAAFVSNERWAAAPPPEAGKFLRVVPDIIVEVLSSSTATRDRGEKKGIYERNGVREYWVADPLARTVTVFHLVGNKFDGGTAFDERATLRSLVLPELEAPVRKLFPSL